MTALMRVNRYILQPFKLKDKGMFTNKMIFSLLAPILIEQIFIVAIGIADTIMVSHVGEIAVAGISFLTAFNNLIKKILSALSIGGSIIISQYIGKQEKKNANKALKMVFYSTLLLTVVLCIILLIGHTSILSLLTGKVETEVMQSARIYYIFSVLSYPFFATHFVISSAYRAMRNSRIPMMFTIFMMAMNLALKSIFIYIFKWGVFGAGLSTLLSIMFVEIILTTMICKRTNVIYIEKIYKIQFDFSMVKRIFGIAIPNSIDNGMFQLGLVMLQRLVATFGTVALAANAIVKSLTPLTVTLTQSISLAIVTIVGQCMGAEKPKQAAMYTMHVLKISYITGLIISIASIFLGKPLIGAFNLSEQTSELALIIFIIYCAGSIFLYPLNNVLPNALRAAGDTKFVMTTSILTMFGARIGLAYILSIYFNLGLIGVWVTVLVDWLVRSIMFSYRFSKGRWKYIKVV